MSAAKQKGTYAETAVVTYLQGQGFATERRALAGRNDHGDVAGIPGVVIEVKNKARMELAEWIDEALREAIGQDLAVVWHKRRGRSMPSEWYVTMTGKAFAELLKESGR